MEITTETKISDDRAKILQSLANVATAILRYVEVERAGIHAEIIPGKDPIENSSLIDYLGGEAVELAGELYDCIFREEHPAEYAQRQAERGGTWRSGARKIPYRSENF